MVREERSRSAAVRSDDSYGDRELRSRSEVARSWARLKSGIVRFALLRALGVLAVRFSRCNSSVGDPRLHDTASATLFPLHNSLVLWPILDEQPFIRLDDVVQLQGEEILGIGELFDNERQDPLT